MDRTSIIAEAMSRISTTLFRNQTDEQFCMLLESYGLGDLVSASLPYFLDTQKNGNIILFGDSKIKIKDIHGCLKILGIDKKRFEHVPFNEVTNYNFKKLEYNNSYRLILVGPMPHSAKGMGDKSSIIEWLISNKNIAKTIRFDNLKVTKSAFKETIEKEIEMGYLEVD